MKEDFRVRSGIVRWPMFPRAKPIENRRSEPEADPLRSAGFQPALRLRTPKTSASSATAKRGVDCGVPIPTHCDNEADLSDARAKSVFVP